MTEANILLVDDEVAFTKSLSRLLAVKGFKVSVANDGKSALKAFGEEKFDIVVLDLKMPGMDGIATLEEINALGLLTETLILTGHGSKKAAAQAKALGAYDFINKPCEIHDLLDRIKNALKKKKNIETKDGLSRMIRI